MRRGLSTERVERQRVTRCAGNPGQTGTDVLKDNERGDASSDSVTSSQVSSGLDLSDFENSEAQAGSLQD